MAHSLSNQLHLTDDLITIYTHPATIRVISDNNTASHKALTIVSLSFVTIRNRILSVGKRLKGTGFYIHPNLPKEEQDSRKLLRSFFLATNKEKSAYIDTRLRISNTIFGISDTASLTTRFPHAADKPRSLNP